MACKTLAYLTMKGGVGKTTLAANITRAMADRGEKRRILLIDTDAQCNLTQMFTSEEELDRPGVRTLFQAFDASGKLYDPADLKAALYESPLTGSTIDFVSGSFETFKFVIAPQSTKDAAQERFRRFMKQAQSSYDIVVLDTNPSATFVTLEALAASNFLVAPITYDAFAMRGIDLIRTTLRERHSWLADPNRLLLVPNKVPRGLDKQSQFGPMGTKVKAVKERFPELSESLSVARIHTSAYLDGDISKRGYGFAYDLINHGTYEKQVQTDFMDVATELDNRMKRAFGNETKDKATTVSAVRGFFAGLGGSGLGRH